MSALVDVVTLANTYATWANDRVLTATEKIPAQEFTTFRQHSNGSVRDILMHMLEAQQIWIGRIFDVPIPPALKPEDFPDVAAIRSRGRELDAQLAQQVERIGEAGLAAPFEYESRSKTFSHPRWQSLLHQANHQMQHRSEVALILTELGSSPGDIDLGYFLRERA